MVYGQTKFIFVKTYFTDVVMKGRIVNHTGNVQYVTVVLGAVFMNNIREVTKMT